MKNFRGMIRVLAVVLFLFSSNSNADQICNSLPYPLTAGTTASGAQVVADLNYLVTCRNATPSFSVYLSANQSVPDSVFTKVAFNTKSYDVGNYFDSSTNHRYAPQLAGKYLIIGQISAPASASIFVPAIYKNGISIAKTYLTGSAGVILQTSVIVSLNGSSDYVELFGYLGGGGSFGGGDGLTFLQGYWLGP